MILRTLFISLGLSACLFSQPTWRQIRSKPLTTTGEPSIPTTGLQIYSVNPTLETTDFSFFTSVKGLVVETVFNDGGPLGVGLASQLDIEADSSTEGSAQALRGNVRVANGAETYGILGYVDIQTLTPQIAAIAGITRGLLADPGANAAVTAVAAVSETDYRSTNGVAVYSSAAENSFYYGVRVYSSNLAAFAGTVDASGTGLITANLSPAAGAPDTQQALYLDRVYGDIGDKLTMTFGSGTPNTPAGKISMLAVGSGFYGYTFDLDYGGTLREIMRMSAEGKVSIGTSTFSSTLFIHDTISGDTDVVVRAGASEDWFLQAWQTSAGGTGLAVSSGAQLMFGNVAEGACDSTTRGTVAHVQGGAGVADTLRICSKDGADAYAWRSLL